MSFKGLIGGFAFACLAIASAGVSFALWVADRIFDAVMSVAAAPTRPLNSFDGSARLFGSPLAYAGPTMDLRHEAGTSRRAAARGI